MNESRNEEDIVQMIAPSDGNATSRDKSINERDKGAYQAQEVPRLRLQCSHYIKHYKYYTQL